MRISDWSSDVCSSDLPWASLRVKLEQQFHRHGAEPSADLMETSSYLAALAFVGQRGAVAFLAQLAAQQFERQGLCRILRIPLELDEIGRESCRERGWQ